MSTPNEPVVLLDGIEMAFGTNRVLRGVTLPLHRGRITALLGANGAGKSTLIKILSGVYTATGGRIVVEGEQVSIDSPMDATKRGIHTVHQRVDENIVPDLSVAENLVFPEIVAGIASFVGSPRSRIPRAREMLRKLGLEWPDRVLMADAFQLSIADQQLLLLARALDSDPKVLVLDEPTSTLSHSEADRLFHVVRNLRGQGVAILYVSHHLNEIRDLADDLVVLRDGIISDRQDAPLRMDEAVRSMLGNEGAVAADEIVEQRGTDVVLELSGVQLLPRSEPIELNIRAGEVTGILGLVGAGKSELARGIVGAEAWRAGTMRLDGKRYAPRHVGDAVRRGIYLAPENRAEEAMLPGWDIARTLTLPFMNKVARRGPIDFAAEQRLGRRLIESFRVVATSPRQSVDALSGGNQQKVVVGRWLDHEPRLMVLDEPFRGVDIGARREISRKVRAIAGRGAALVVLASDVEEIREVADRIVVLVDGEIALDRYTSEVDADAIMQSMSQEEAHS
ncbi:sugar ABC transporter ATP-binding protein [Enemella sp. A6]|uniref:sugar ABC transporter ATP-binding protein n=1 Tax=Enemella sp. A6 TaxID=3440152 RepID=UPI003EC00E6F